MLFSTLFSILAFLLILAGPALVKNYRSDLAITLPEVVVAILPVLIFLLLAGKIQFVGLGNGVVLRAIDEATSSPIAQQVVPLPTEPVEASPKLGLAMIPRYIEQQTEGLTFELGVSNYEGEMIGKYLAKLTIYPYLKYVLIEYPDGTFFGMVDAQAFSALLPKDGGMDGDQFAKWLAEDNRKALLQQLPRLLSAEVAITKDTETSQALRRMEELGVNILPVVDETGDFVGVVERSRLVAGLLLNLSHRLENQ